MQNNLRINMNKLRTPIEITNHVLATLYNRLLNTVIYKKSLYNVNLNLGSSHDPHDYVQETLITLYNKYRQGTAVFYTMSQLWSYCLGILEMRLLRQHRDYTLVKSRTCYKVDIEGETVNGAKIEDIASFLNTDTLKEVDNIAFLESLKSYILGFIGSNATIVPIGKLFTLDSSNKVISVYALVSAIDSLGLSKAFTLFNIPKWEHCAILEVLADFLNLKDPTIGYSTCKPCKHVLNKREKYQISYLKKHIQSNSMLSLEELKGH